MVAPVCILRNSWIGIQPGDAGNKHVETDNEIDKRQKGEWPKRIEQDGEAHRKAECESKDRHCRRPKGEEMRPIEAKCAIKEVSEWHAGLAVYVLHTSIH